MTIEGTDTEEKRPARKRRTPYKQQFKKMSLSPEVGTNLTTDALDEDEEARMSIRQPNPSFVEHRNHKSISLVRGANSTEAYFSASRRLVLREPLQLAEESTEEYSDLIANESPLKPAKIPRSLIGSVIALQPVEANYRSVVCNEKPI